MPDIQDWLRAHKPQWKLRQPRTEQDFFPRTLFGEEDAATEWEHNLNPQQIFAPIASYEEFSAHGALFLFGRRGTGKTALLHMLTHAINSGGSLKHYSCAVLLQPVVAELLPVFRGARLAELEETDLLSLLRLVWHWLIVSAAYIGIVQKYPQARAQESELATKFNKWIDEDSSDCDITRYLLDELFSIFKTTFENVSDGANQLALITIALRERLGNVSTRVIERQIKAIFQKQRYPALILIETEEVYQVNDRFASSVRSALIDALLEIYKHFTHSGVLAKAAFLFRDLPDSRNI